MTAMGIPWRPVPTGLATSVVMELLSTVSSAVVV